MNGTLYILKSSKTSLVYVGKTYQDVDIRLRQHASEALQDRSSNRKLYKAIRKFGIDSFSLKVIGVYPEGELELEEVRLISELDSFNNGLNSTKGGDGTRYLKISDDLIIAKYKDLGSIVATSNFFKIDPRSVKNVLVGNNIEVKTTKEVLRSKELPIRIVEVNEVFNNAQECAEFLIDAEIANNTTCVANISRSIRRCAEGSRKTYLGLRFEFMQA